MKINVVYNKDVAGYADALNILENERSYDCNDMCLSIKEILTLIDE